MLLGTIKITNVFIFMHYFIIIFHTKSECKVRVQVRSEIFLKGHVRVRGAHNFSWYECGARCENLRCDLTLISIHTIKIITQNAITLVYLSHLSIKQFLNST